MPPAVRSEPAPLCSVCHVPGALLYRDVHDQVWRAPGVYALRRCASCGLIWLDPRPVAADLVALYPSGVSESAYGIGRGRSWFDQPDWKDRVRPALVRLGYADAIQVSRDALDLPSHRLRLGGLEPAERALMHVPGPPSGTLLDAGCGDGAFAAHMGRLGWRSLGLELEAGIAAEARRRHGVDVIVGNLESLPVKPRSLRVITMHHVLDHLHDPADALRACREALVPGGRLVVVSPNAESAGRKAFGLGWVNLDPPRHLHIFSPESLGRLAEAAGLHVERLWTSALRATAVHHLAAQFRQTGRFLSEDAERSVGPTSRLFGAYERALLRVRPAVGEEVVLVAST